MNARLGQYRQVAALAFGAMLFLLDAATRTDGLASTLYILVLVWFAEQQQRSAVLAVALCCVVLTAATYPFAHGIVASYDPFFRRAVSCVAIIAASPVILHSVAVREALSRQDSFLDMSNHPIIARNGAGAVTYWNGAAERLYGWSAGQAVGKDFASLLSARLSEPLSEAQAVLQRSGSWEGQVVHRRRDGAEVTVLSHWFAQSSSGPGHVLDIATDITALRRVAEMLKLGEARYRSIFDTVNVGIWEQDYSAVAARVAQLQLQGIVDFESYCREMPDFVRECIGSVRLVDVNAAAMKIFEAAGKNDLLKSLEAVYLPETRVAFAKIIAAIANGAIFCTARTELRTLQGRRISAQISINFPASPRSIDSVLVSIVDDTERQAIQEGIAQARESLVQVNRMTALGEMTARIAHQVNHPLAAIIANSEASLRWLNRAVPDYQEAHAAIAAAAHNATMAAQVVAHIRALGSHDTEPASNFQISDVVADACHLLERQLERQNIALTLDLPQATVAVIGSRIEIEQVVLNLLMNAIESLTQSALSRRIIIRVEPGKNEVLVRIEDNGEGIAAEIMPRLFSPFYTTKPSGMGLGLSISRAIISKHGGTISFHKTQACGAAVAFTLPIAPAAAMPDAV